MRDGQKIQQARKLRGNMTDAENKIWYYLRDRRFFDFKFRRQFAVGPYIADFAAADEKLIIELDGGQHAEQKSYDDRRDYFLQQQGFTVLRFWNNEVLENIEGVLTMIKEHLCPHPDPLPLFPLRGAGEGEVSA